MIVRAPRRFLVVSSVLGLALALGGCPPDRVDELQCGVTPTDALVACPSEAALVKHLRDRWQLQARVAISARCVPGHFGGAGWIIHGTARDGASVASALFVLQPSCGALTDAALRPGELPYASYEAIDLDGDKVDEVMVRRTEREPGGTSTGVEAHRVASGRLRLAGKVRVAYDGVDPDQPGSPALRCTGIVRYLNRTDAGFLLEIEATRSTASELCLADGNHRFELTLSGLRRTPSSASGAIP
jgi:hypothetical protein